MKKLVKKFCVNLLPKKFGRYSMAGKKGDYA